MPAPGRGRGAARRPARHRRRPHAQPQRLRALERGVSRGALVGPVADDRRSAARAARPVLASAALRSPSQPARGDAPRLAPSCVRRPRLARVQRRPSRLRPLRESGRARPGTGLRPLFQEASVRPGGDAERAVGADCAQRQSVVPGPGGPPRRCAPGSAPRAPADGVGAAGCRTISFCARAGATCWSEGS